MGQYPQKFHHLEKSTPPPVNAVVTNMSYAWMTVYWGLRRCLKHHIIVHYQSRKKMGLPQGTKCVGTRIFGLLFKRFLQSKLKVILWLITLYGLCRLASVWWSTSFPYFRCVRINSVMPYDASQQIIKSLRDNLVLKVTFTGIHHLRQSKSITVSIFVVSQLRIPLSFADFPALQCPWKPYLISGMGQKLILFTYSPQ